MNACESPMEETCLPVHFHNPVSHNDLREISELISGAQIPNVGRGISTLLRRDGLSLDGSEGSDHPTIPPNRDRRWCGRTQ